MRQHCLSKRQTVPVSGKTKLLFSRGAFEFAPPAPFGYQDRMPFRVLPAAIDRLLPIGLETLDASRAAVSAPVKSALRAGFAARHGTAAAGVEILQRLARRQTTFDQYRAKSDSGAPLGVQQQVVFSHYAQTCQNGCIFKKNATSLNVIRQRLGADSMRRIQPGPQCLRYFRHAAVSFGIATVEPVQDRLVLRMMHGQHQKTASVGNP